MTETNARPERPQTETEMQRQTKLLEKINDKLAVFMFFFVLYIIGSVLNFILSI